jgi:2-methylcitrate dehydratase PrpD
MGNVDAAIILSRNVVNTKYEDIPADALEVSKKLVLDIIATTLGGGKARGCEELVRLIQDWGGKKESTILGYGYRVPAPNAAQANASMAHALDYDDTHDGNIVHASVVVVPVCLAVAEMKEGVSGKEFITAVTLGLDLSTRLSGATKFKTDLLYDGWWNTSLYGYFSAAASAGKILKVDEEKMVNAFGIAYEQAGGTMQCSLEAALTKRMCPGFAARGGIVSALMAQRGITGAKNSLEGKAGLFTIFYSGGCDREYLIRDLGRKFEGANLSLKPYPTCRANHPAIDATLNLVHEHAIKPEDVQEVTVSVGRGAYTFTCTPLELKRKPKTIVDAQFSLPWTVATAIVHNKVVIKDFSDEAIKDQQVIEIAQKVTPKLDDNLTVAVGVEPEIVEIKTGDGRLLSKRVDFPYGHPKKPMSWDSLVDKLKDCALYATKPISMTKLRKIVDAVMGIEKMDNVKSIVEFLS